MLTRAPGSLRLDAHAATDLLAEEFGVALRLPGDLARALPGHLPSRSVEGGAVHDALVALAAQTAGVSLLTRDGCAVGTHHRLGVACEVGGDPAS